MTDSSYQSDLFSLAGKVALVTGGSSGLGAHFVQVLAAAGARVIAGARRTDKLKAVVETVVNQGGVASAVEIDVTNKYSVDEALRTCESIYGPVTVLVNNAGLTRSSRFINTDEAAWDQVMNTNLKATWRLSQAVCQRMLNENLSGSIINIASILGLRVGFGESSYAISKAGVIQLTKAMALELANKNIRVNAICPGYFKTEINAEFLESENGKKYIDATPAKRHGHLSELDAPLLLLASDAGSFINGVALPVDGGHLVSSL